MLWLGHVRTQEDEVGLRNRHINELAEQVAATRDWVVVGDLARILGSGENGLVLPPTGRASPARELPGAGGAVATGQRADRLTRFSRARLTGVSENSNVAPELNLVSATRRDSRAGSSRRTTRHAATSPSPGRTRSMS